MYFFVSMSLSVTMCWVATVIQIGCTLYFRGDGKMDGILEEKNPIDVLHNILQQVANHQKSG